MHSFAENPIVRIVPVALAALLVTLVLFLCMHLLIAMEQPDLVRSKHLLPHSIIMPKHEPDILHPTEKVEPVPPPEEAPEIPITTVDPVEGVRMKGDFSSPVEFDPISGPENGSGVLDGSVIAQVRVSPIYPERARTRGLEGYVDLSFTVLENGVVADVLVVDSQPGGVFDRAAVKAVKKWRYRPQIVNGEPVVTENIETRMTFKLD